MKYIILAAALRVADVAAQTTISNPEVYISGCDALSCASSDSNDSWLCRRDQYPAGVGIAPRVVQIPGSNTNLSLSLVDSDPKGTISAPYRYYFLTQNLYIGAPPDLNLRDQQPGCALMFQHEAQTFPFLNGLASPNTTKCGDALNRNDMELLAKHVSDFDVEVSTNTTTSELGIPRCAALAQYLMYRMQERLGFGGYYNEKLVTITGGAFIGPDLNTTSDAEMYGSCHPVLPESYQLYNVLNTQQVLHPDIGYDPGMGGRNGTTPIMTVMYGSNGTAPNIQFFCMQQLAPGNRQLPKEQSSFESAAQRGNAINKLGMGIASLAFVVMLLF